MGKAQSRGPFLFSLTDPLKSFKESKLENYHNNNQDDENRSASVDPERPPISYRELIDRENLGR